MIEPYKPKDVWWLLGVAHRWIGGELRGEHGGPQRTAVARLLALTAVLVFAGSILGTAFTALWPMLAVVVAVVVMVRMVRRLLRRFGQR